VKKDILAAITFLATGLLFYAIQTGSRADDRFTYGPKCDSAETVLVETAAPDAEPSIILDGGVTRDS